MFVKQIENGLDLSGEAKCISAVYDTYLEPGQSIPLHYHPGFEELYYVLTGHGMMTMGEERQEISRSDVVYIPPLAQHALLNTGNVPLRFITISVGITRDLRQSVSLE